MGRDAQGIGPRVAGCVLSPYSSSPRRSSRGTLRALASVGSLPVLVNLLYQPCTLQFGGLVLDRTEGTAGLEVSGLMCSKTFLAVACSRSMYAW